jgi:antitoxin YefM
MRWRGCGNCWEDKGRLKGTEAFSSLNASVPFKRSGTPPDFQLKNLRALVFVMYAHVESYGIPVHNMVASMDTVSVNKFRDNLKKLVEQSLRDHEPLRVTRRSGDDFVVISAEDWEREQETLHVLQNSKLMQQIAESAKTHAERNGYTPTKEQMDEITGV